MQINKDEEGGIKKRLKISQKNITNQKSLK